jgi:mono/diheme cytochrome c family protein
VPAIAVRITVVLIGCLLPARFMLADEAAITLKGGPGRDAVLANCLGCHSADYIVMNSPFLDEKSWRASVTKMIKVMGAPISPEQAEIIVRYLAANYGVQPD